MDCFYQENSSTGLFSHLYLTMRHKKPLNKEKKRVIVISGPTGVGKTALSLAAAKILGGEIISADSMQVYRKMDIGTAKVSEKDRKEIPHHMIDICDINENFNVVEFYNKARKACNDILLKDKVPIVVGGTGFYIHSFLYGPPQGPPSSPDIRKNLEHQMEQMGSEVLYERLQMLDPHYAATITENDRHKIVRALEIITITKKPVSCFSITDSREKDIYDFRCWFITMPREALYARAEMRCEEMIEKGFVQEVEALEKMGLKDNYTASQAIGYRQCLEFLKTDRSEKEKSKFLDLFKQATRNYIKRQITWFRKESDFRWLDLYEIDFNRALEFILQDYEQGR